MFTIFTEKMYAELLIVHTSFIQVMLQNMYDCYKSLNK